MVGIADNGDVIRNCPFCGSTASSEHKEMEFTCWNEKCGAKYTFEPGWAKGSPMDKAIITKQPKTNSKKTVHSRSKI